MFTKLTNLIKERNELEREKINASDRVDISLQEYLKMKEQIEELTQSNKNMRETIDVLLKPFVEARVNPSLVEKIFKGEVEKTEVVTFKDCASCTQQIVYRVIVKESEMK